MKGITGKTSPEGNSCGFPWSFHSLKPCTLCFLWHTGELSIKELRDFDSNFFSLPKKERTVLSDIIVPEVKCHLTKLLLQAVSFLYVPIAVRHWKILKNLSLFVFKLRNYISIKCLYVHWYASRQLKRLNFIFHKSLPHNFQLNLNTTVATSINFFLNNWENIVMTI